MTVFAYQPAWNGAPVWDDAGHITRVDLRGVDGLQRIWFERGATQQYYPVTHTAFWVQHRLWGDRTLGYHIVNSALHACSAFLVFLIVRRLGLPGATFAAFVFALHPVHVESVAWITELKNTLSSVFYLAAAWCYLRFDTARSWKSYTVAALLFVLALLSKSVTATLPMALAVVLWWQRGRLAWRRDLLPLVPWVIAGAVAGFATAAVERYGIGAQGVGFDLSPFERVLVAGRAVWFYLGKLVWPLNLSFNYPRWDVSDAVWWQYLYPLALAAAVVVAWMYRRASRVPLAVALCYVVTLAPALGFVDVYPFLFSFVADHFQYLASICVIVFASAAVTQWSRGSSDPRSNRRLHSVIPIAILGLLAALTWQHSRQFADAETLYRTTIASNPASWFARNNLASLLLAQPATGASEAAALLRESVRLRDDNPVGHYNLGLALQQLGQHEQAVTALRKALAQSVGRDVQQQLYGGNPRRVAQVQRYLGKSLLALGRNDEAVAAFRSSLEQFPEAATHVDLGLALVESGRGDDALVEFRRAQQLEPAVAAHASNIGAALLQQGRTDEAVVELSRAVRLEPAFVDARFNLAVALERLGRNAEAIAEFRHVVETEGSLRSARMRLIRLLERTGQVDPAIEESRRAIAAGFDSADLRNDLGLLLIARGDAAAAASEFAQALRLDPSHAQARANLARIRRD